MGSSPDAEKWASRLERGLGHIATVTRLEVGFSSRSGADARSALRGPPLTHMPVQYWTPAVEGRAVEVQLLLAERGEYRAPSIPDLLIAGIAELAGPTVLHVDEDFDLIASVTGQRVERLAL